MEKGLECLENFKKNVSIERLLQDAKRIHVASNNLDYVSYPEFIKYFRNLKKISEHNIVIGINFTYGWMPTIFDFRSDNFTEVVSILNRAKQGQIPAEAELEVLKKCFNNSLVGTSKLLHFVNPNRFAIWDSRVFHYLTNQKPYTYRLDKFKTYLIFLQFCEHVTSQPGYNKIHFLVRKKFNQNEMTKYRTLELIMYESDRNQHKPKS